MFAAVMAELEAFDPRPLSRPELADALAAHDRLISTSLAPNAVYDDNPGFWKAVYRLAAEISSLDYALDRDEVLVWAVKDTAKGHAKAVVKAGRDAVDAAAGVAGAIPTLAKAMAAGALGLAAIAVARR